MPLPVRFRVDRPNRALRITSGSRAWEVTRRHWLPFSAASWAASLLVWAALVLAFCRVEGGAGG